MKLKVYANCHKQTVNTVQKKTSKKDGFELPKRKNFCRKKDN